MSFEEFQKSEDLARLVSAWRDLSWWQKKLILLKALPHLGLVALNRHIQRRRAKFYPVYPAHWIQ